MAGRKYKDEDELSALADAYNMIAGDASWYDENADKEPLVKKTEQFLGKVNKADASDDLKFRCYEDMFHTLIYCDNTVGRGAAVCAVLAGEANCVSSLDDAKLNEMAADAQTYGRDIEPDVREAAHYYIYKRLKNKKDYPYMSDVKYYKDRIKEFKKAAAEKAIAEIDKQIRSEPDLMKRLDLIDKKIALAKEDAFGRENVNRMRAGFCKDAADMCGRESPYYADKILYYKKEGVRYTRLADLAKLHKSGSNTPADKRAYMLKYGNKGGYGR